MMVCFACPDVDVRTHNAHGTRAAKCCAELCASGACIACSVLCKRQQNLSCSSKEWLSAQLRAPDQVFSQPPGTFVPPDLDQRWNHTSTQLRRYNPGRFCLPELVLQRLTESLDVGRSGLRSAYAELQPHRFQQQAQSRSIAPQCQAFLALQEVISLERPAQGLQTCNLHTAVQRPGFGQGAVGVDHDTVNDCEGRVDLVALIVDGRHEDLAELCEQQLRFLEAVRSFQLWPRQEPQRCIEIAFEKCQPATLRIHRWEIGRVVIAFAQCNVLHERTPRILGGCQPREQQNLDGENQSEVGLTAGDIRACEPFNGDTPSNCTRSRSLVQIGQQVRGRLRVGGGKFSPVPARILAGRHRELAQ